MIPLQEAVERYPAYGFSKLFKILRRWGGHSWNHKRVYRVYCELNLNKRRRGKKRLPSRYPGPLAVPAAANGITQPIRFQGQWADEETGLYYNRHRYYDPDMGRYITSDPIGLAGGLNGYGYVGDPLVSIDALGLSEWRLYSKEQIAQKFQYTLDTLSNGTYFLGAGGDIVFGKGYTFSSGIMINADSWFMDSGLYFSGGEAYGLEYGGVLEAGFCTCSNTYDVYGEEETLSLSAPLVGIDIPGDISAAPVMAQFRPGTPGISYSKPFTYPITPRVVWDGLKSIFNSW